MSTRERKLAANIRARLGPVPILGDPPLVSIVVLNRNGIDHLRSLLEGLIDHTDYPRLELIVVDNGSSDESVEFIRSAEAPFPISIVVNQHNESFSDANNRGAELAVGELLLFLNNDIRPFEDGWLTEMVACHERPEVGAAGATLIAPEGPGEAAHGYRLQTRGGRMRGASDKIMLASDSQRTDVFDSRFGEDFEGLLPIGASILVSRRVYHEVGGFTHGYFYGGEDADLALKIRATGRRFVCSGRSLLIHRDSSTRKVEMSVTELKDQQGRNVRMFWNRWGARLWREYELDRLAGTGLWAVPGQENLDGAPTWEEVLRLGFCLHADTEDETVTAAAKALRAALSRRGHRCTVVDEEPAPIQALAYDIVIHVRGPKRHVLETAQMHVLWGVSHIDALSAIECSRYDLAVVGNKTLAAHLREGADTPVALLRSPLAADALIDAVLSRADEVNLPLRVAPDQPPEPSGP